MQKMYSKDLFLLHLKRLSEYLELENGQICTYFFEIEKDSELLADIESAVKDVDFFKKKRWNQAIELGLYRIVTYALARAYKPMIFVESGVLHGLSSVVILSALCKNRKGILFSIDAPSYFKNGPANKDGFQDTLPPNKEPGWIISARYLDRWKLLLGRTSEILPELPNRHTGIEIFLHDSEHTYETMWMEFTYAWDVLKERGILMSDNICCNSAFFDFCKKVKRFPLVFPEINLTNNCQDDIRFGLIKK